MALLRAASVTTRRPRRRSDWRAILHATRRHGIKAALSFWRAPVWVRIFVATLVILALWSVVNVAYHVIRKPTELLFPVSGVLMKPPAETWRQYGPLFRRYATPSISPELLAALAQSESAGNPMARTYWRWRFSWNPLNLYQPASSAVGMYQMTDGAFAEAKHYCIRDHRLVEDGAWYDLGSCWLNALYMRIIPSHAVELTAIYLERKVAGIAARAKLAGATLEQKQDLAALVHLCGAGVADNFARRGFHLAPGERCGDHEAAAYLARVNTAKRQFTRLAAVE